MATRVLVMSHGRIVQSGPPDRVLSDNAEAVLEIRRRSRLKSTDSQGGGGGAGGGGTGNVSQLVEEEQKMVGVVEAHVYWTYLSYTGRSVGVFLVVATFLMYVFHSGQDVWMTHWLRQISAGNSTSNGNGTENFTLWSDDGLITDWYPPYRSYSVSERRMAYKAWLHEKSLRSKNETWIPLESSTDELYYYLG